MRAGGDPGEQPDRDDATPPTGPQGLPGRLLAWLRERNGVIEAVVGIPILAALAIVAVTAGSGSTLPAAVPPVASAPASGAAGGVEATTGPSTPGEIGDGGLEAGREKAATPQEIASELAPQGLVLVDAPPAQLDLSFNVASFNVLGASHTDGRKSRRGYSNSMARLGGQIRALEQKSITIAGMQEFQVKQIRAFKRATGDRYSIYPGDSGNHLLADNSIIWRNDTWELLDQRITNIPYFKGRPRGMPQVLLRHRTTGHRVWVGNFHNPADVHGPAGRWRAQAVAIEARLAKELGADGTPVIFTGDMNDRAAFACPFTAQSGMVSADGARTDDGRCVLPSAPWIDWVLGSREIAFSNYQADYGVKQAKLTDHPIVVATATLAAPKDASQCQIRPSTKGSLWFCPAKPQG